MTKNFSNGFLTVLWVLSIPSVASLTIGFVTVALVFIVIAIVMLVHPSSALGMLRYGYPSAHLSDIWVLALAGILVLALLACMALISYSVFRLIENIRHNIYFEARNLKFIRYVLWAYAGAIILQFFGALVNDIWNLNMNGLLSDQSSGGRWMIWIVVYVIYVMFKRGIALQDDANKIV